MPTFISYYLSHHSSSSMEWQIALQSHRRLARNMFSLYFLVFAFIFFAGKNRIFSANMSVIDVLVYVFFIFLRVELTD